MVSAGRGNRIGKRRSVEPIEEHLPPCEIDPAVAAAEPWEATSGEQRLPPRKDLEVLMVEIAGSAGAGQKESSSSEPSESYGGGMMSCALL